MRIISEKHFKLSDPEYYVLFSFVNEWEDEFWENLDGTLAELVSDSGRVYFSKALFSRLNTIFANTLSYFYRERIGERGPILKLNAGFAPESLKNEVKLQLKEELISNPGLLFEGRELLRRYCRQCIFQHSEYMREFLSNVLKNKKQIEDEFFEGKSFSQIIYIDCEAGDCHFGGRRTITVRTDQGLFMYKPHNMSADVIFKELTDEFFEGFVKVPRTIDCQAYGFAEYLPSARVNKKEECKPYFYRLGGTAAIIQLLGSIDFHKENILCSDGYPALVDLEMLLTPAGFSRVDRDRNTENGYTLYYKDLESSIIKSGFLPKRKGKTEYSALMNMDKDSTLPLIDGKVQLASDYFEDFAEGFKKVYSICIDNRNRLAEKIRQFANAPFRLMLRNTDDYAKQLQRLYTVTALGSEEITAQLLNSIVMQNPLLSEVEKERIAEVERNALSLGDIPVFNTYGGKCELYCRGEALTDKMWEFSPVENALNRLSRMSADECRFELDIIKNSLKYAIIDSKEPLPNVDAKPFDRVDYKAEAKEIFEYVLKEKVQMPNGKNGWFGILNDRNIFGMLQPEQSMGTLGLAAFLAEYYYVFKDVRAKALARECMESALLLIDTIIQDQDVYKFEMMKSNLDIPGLVHSFAKVGRYLEDGLYFDKITAFVDRIYELEEELLKTDYYSGAAGVLYTIASNEHFKNCRHYEDAIRRLSDDILKNRTLPGQDGILGWDTAGKKRFISGLGHGSAGIGIALLKAGKALGEEKYILAAQDAMSIEHNMYSEKLKTWPDFRTSAVGDNFMHGICSGAPGMALAYLQFIRLGERQYLEDFKKAIDFCSDYRISIRDHYCCGNSGAVEALLDSAYTLDEEKYITAADKILSYMISRKKETGQYRFLPQGYKDNTPVNFYFGLAGVGHVLLRRIDKNISNFMV